MASTTKRRHDADELRRLSQQGLAEGFVVEGPFGYDACISRDAAVQKGLSGSAVAGDPGLLPVSNLEAANLFGTVYKYPGGADSGGLVMAARAPVILNSRSDSVAHAITR